MFSKTLTLALQFFCLIQAIISHIYYGSLKLRLPLIIFIFLLLPYYSNNYSSFPAQNSMEELLNFSVFLRKVKTSKEVTECWKNYIFVLNGKHSFTRTDLIITGCHWTRDFNADGSSNIHHCPEELIPPNNKSCKTPHLFTFNRLIRLPLPKFQWRSCRTSTPIGSNTFSLCVLAGMVAEEA